MSAARSDMKSTPRRNRRLAILVAAVSASALLGACEVGPTPAEIAQVEWQTAARLDTPPAYEAYLRMYPAGEFNVVARQRIEELRIQESAAYQAARKIDNEDAYVSYLARFPWGLNSAEADARRATLAAPRLAAEENKAWQDVRKSDRIEVYEKFLADWPRGSHATEAGTKLDALWRTDQGAFVRAMRSGSPGEIQAFMQAWPRSTYVEEARRELDIIRVRDDEAWRRALADNSV
ncbi:MAG: hypothetical protein EON61_09800, partial [Alphaproteobacteria bacterium]